MGWKMMVSSNTDSGIGDVIREWIKEHIFGGRNPVVPKNKQDEIDRILEEPGQKKKASDADETTEEPMPEPEPEEDEEEQPKKTKTGFRRYINRMYA